MDNVEYEYFEFLVDTANQSYNQKFQLNKNVKLIHGILFTSTLEEMIYYRGRQRIEINGREYFPQGYETKLLMTSLNISPNDKYYELGGVKPGDGIIKINYQDTDHPRFSLSPYKVQMYVKCEIE